VHILGLGFITSIAFVFGTGVFFSRCGQLLRARRGGDGASGPGSAARWPALAAHRRAPLHPCRAPCSWLGSWMLGFGEWVIKRLPLIKHIYSASKQVGGGGRGRAGARQRRPRLFSLFSQALPSPMHRL
jgi:hypothetical protein